MSRKKFENKDIIQAIKDKFGSIEEFAERLEVTPQAVYSRIDNQNRKFIKELEGYGITIIGNKGIAGSEVHGKDFTFTENITEGYIENLSLTINLLKAEVERLRLENDSLRKGN